MASVWRWAAMRGQGNRGRVDGSPEVGANARGGRPDDANCRGLVPESGPYLRKFAPATAIYAGTRHWAMVIPVEAWSGGIASAILIGAFAGLMPAVRASRLPPTVALRTA